MIPMENHGFPMYVIFLYLLKSHSVEITVGLQIR